MTQSLTLPWINNISAIYCSAEQKAIDGAHILAQHCNLSYTKVATLGENDRSATGFLHSEEFEAAADAFFAQPDTSIRGWERATDAQARIVSAIENLDAKDNSTGALAVVSHGAVGTLLYCNLTGKDISRRFDQPGKGGGYYLKLQLQSVTKSSWWTPID